MLLQDPFELTGEPLPRPYKRAVERAPDPPERDPAVLQLDLPERAVEIPEGLLITSATLSGRTPCLPFRHTSWAVDRARLLTAFQTTGQPANRVASFRDCGNTFWILQDNASPHDIKVVPHRCHDRFCIPCGNERVEDVRKNLSERLTDQPHRFVTLTIKSADEPLTDLLDHLLASFRRLRQAKWWRERVDGGCAFIEVTHNPGRDSWHPHLHIICTGKFLPKRELSKAWHVATVDSCIVKIKLIEDRHHVLNYVTKYVTKPLPKSVRYQPARLAECVTALKGRRLIITFGAWSRWKLTARDTIGNWTVLGQLHTLSNKAREGDQDAENILTSIYAIAALNDERVSTPPPDS